LDEQWCGFLARNRFLVGLSLDGPADLDGVRRSRNGRPVHEMVMRALGLLREHRCEFNVLIVISKANVDHPERVFRFLVENDLHFAQVIPCTEPDGAGGLSEHSITGRQYGEFMVRLFDAWADNDDPSYYVRHIDNWLHLYFGLGPVCCEYRRDCSNLVTVEWNGDVYPCDFFVREEFRMGNLSEQTLERMLGGRPFREFVRAAERAPAMCAGCQWLWACHGGCYRHRGKLGIGPDGMPFLCEANQSVFSHAFAALDEAKRGPGRPRLHGFLNELDARVKAGEFDAQAPAERAPSAGGGASTGRPGRNDLCPCGSGRKFKACCMSRNRVLYKA